ncbi:hypothetical protein GHK92_04375 [Nocardioides sp. dk4132]|uniref:hypothetical protein n=1 Tax=unclassified Nocardioides TaxID=2615069 RepID=UPI0012957551|nr:MULTISPECIES: hypothetical protein [unclassified Nocardioides]MQW75100.1 hypothetical protein [Nocardioides sp. dk4132]QGA07734.1 hypothetical protein GFH29_10235 [Nocardioides sp. dk884]
MSTNLPASGRLAWWATAWLRGHVVTDLVVDAVLGDDVTHAVAGLHALGLGGPEGTDTLVGGLARLRAEGARSVGAAFPVEGDPVGLGGPADFNAAALEAGEAVVTDVGVGLVPVSVGPATTWVAHRAQRRQLPDVGEADRALRRELLEAASALAALDVARWRPEVADLLMNLRHRAPLSAPPGVPPRCVDLAERATQAVAIVEAALVDDGAAISAHEADARRAALVGLDRAGRRALVAACSPEAWPPG